MQDMVSVQFEKLPGVTVVLVSSGDGVVFHQVLGFSPHSDNFALLGSQNLKACDIKILNLFVLGSSAEITDETASLAVEFLASDGRARAHRLTLRVEVGLKPEV